MALIDVGGSTTSPKTAFPDRLKEISEDISALLSAHKPELVAMERLFFNQNTTTAMQVAEARGAILLTCAQHSIPVLELTPSQVKMALTGVGNAEKSQVEQMVVRLLNLRVAPKPDDAADALAVAITASTMNLQ